MDAVGLDVDEVVDGVDRPGEQAEDARRRRGTPGDGEVERRPERRAEEHVLVKDDGGEDEDVLDPLVRTQRLDERAETSRAGRSHGGIVAAATA